MSARVWVPGFGYCKIVCKDCGKDAYAGHICPPKRPKPSAG